MSCLQQFNDNSNKFRYHYITEQFSLYLRKKTVCGTEQPKFLFWFNHAEGDLEIKL